MNLAASGPLRCPKCSSSLDPDQFSRGGGRSCWGCGVELIATTFPALWRGAGASEVGVDLTIGDEAACFFHEGKQAQSICQSGGRYLCALCHTEIAGMSLCPSCLDKGVRKQEVAALEKRRFIAADAALLIAVLSLILWPLSIIGGPAVLYIVIRYWNAPGSLVRRSKPRFIVSLFIAAVPFLVAALIFISISAKEGF